MLPNALIFVFIEVTPIPLYFSSHRLRSRHSKSSNIKASSSSSSSSSSLKSLKANTTQLAASIPEGNTVADGNDVIADGNTITAVGNGSGTSDESNGANVKDAQPEEEASIYEEKEEAASDHRNARVAQEMRDWLQKLRLEHWAPKFEVSANFLF